LYSLCWRYVVGVEAGVMRALTAEEETEFQRGHYATDTDRPIVPEETVADDSRCAVMIKIRVVDYWTWTTWMLFETYEEAVAHMELITIIV
jgi:hypothetical protein